MNYLAFDIGGTSVKYAMGDERGNLWNTGFFATPGTDIDALLKEMNGVRLRICEGQDIAGVAVSCPGAVDPGTGIVHGISAVPCIHGIPFRKMLTESFGGQTVSIENDARCFAWGELWKGAAVGMAHFTAITIGSGIGGAMVHDGKVLHGSHFCCGEVSNFPIGAPDGAGELGRWSDYTPVNLAKRYGEALGRPLTGKQLFDMADNGDVAALECLDQFYYYTALGCILIQFAFDPEMIVIGGGVSGREGLIERLNEKTGQILRDEMNYGFLKPRLVISRDANHSNLRGALYCLLRETQEGQDG